jgi:peptidoglycan hydrolase-like protein with peptidoglycan-binding domain
MNATDDPNTSTESHASPPADSQPGQGEASLQGKGHGAFWGAGIAGVVLGAATFFVVANLTAPPADATTQPAPVQPVVPVATPNPVAADATAAPTEPGAAPASTAITDPGVPEDDDSAPVTAPAEPEPPKRTDTETLLAMLRDAHQAHHVGDDTAATQKALDAAYAKVFGRQKTWIAFARAFHNSHGLGRFVRGGRATTLGQALVARIRLLEAEGMNPEGYDLASLAPFVPQEAAPGAASATATASDNERIASFVRGILEAPTFDPNDVRERIESAPAALGVATLGAALQTMGKGQGGGATAADVEAETRFFKAFLNLVLEFRFIRKTGPLIVKTAETVFERDTKNVRKMMATIVDDPDQTNALRHIEPAHPQYKAMQGVLARYRELAAKGPCETLPEGWRFREGSKGKETQRLLQRLNCEGYYEGPVDVPLEGAALEAIRRYQEEHDLEPEKIIGEETIKSLNVPLARRVRQIEVTLQRMRESFHDRMARYFIRVNIPSFLLTVYEDLKPIRQQRVIVGTNRLDDDKVKLIQGHINRTKIFGTRLYQVIVNPTWILPKRVEEGELKTSLDKDPDYLAKQNIKKVRLSSGTEVFIQGSGDGNVLGKVKFLLEESNAIYLHDTDKRHLFKKRRRDFSHGCMRVHEAIDFAKWLLTRAGFTQDEVDRSFRSDAQRGFDMKEPIPLVTEYMTVDLLPDGRPIFFADIYGYDDAVFHDRVPVRETRTWGSELLRPRWVPRVDAKTVDGWRAAGKPAPRDYVPDPNAVPSDEKPADGGKKRRPRR